LVALRGLWVLADQAAQTIAPHHPLADDGDRWLRWSERRGLSQRTVRLPRMPSAQVAEPCLAPHGKRMALAVKAVLERGRIVRADFLRSQAETLLACDFVETVTLTGQRQYILAIIEHANRRIRILGTTAHPTAGWAAQAIKNLVMDLEDTGCRARYLIRDRDGKFPAFIDEILADAGIQTVRCGVRVLRMNAIMERWVQSCRHELLDRTLIWNERHLRHALQQYGQFYNVHRAHQTMMQAGPLRAVPAPITDIGRIAHLDIRRRDRCPFPFDQRQLDLRGLRAS